MTTHQHPSFRSLPSLAVLLALLVPWLLLLACGDMSRQPLRPRHVILVTVDTLRADHLGTYGYARATSPFLDELGTRGVLFERAIAQWPKTGPSFAAMFTGQYPLTTGLTHQAAIRIPDGYLTLPEFLKTRGFTTLGVSSNGVLSSELAWNQGFDEYLETGALFHFEEGDQRSYRNSMNALRVNELAFPLLEKHRKAERLFAWIHYSDPHTPYLLPEGFDNPFVGDEHYVGDEPVRPENGESKLIDGREDRKYYVAMYDGNILVVDRAIRELIGRLGDLGLLADTLLIFTADHGESLYEHDSFLEHGRLPYNTTAHVPLFLWETYRPEAAGRRIALPVELVDLYPTIRDLVAPGVEVAGFEGKPLLPFLRGPAQVPEGVARAFGQAFSQAGGGSPLTHWRSVQGERFKVVFHPARPGRTGEEVPPIWELYDLAADPLETHNLTAELAADLDAPNTEEVKRLRELLEKWMDGRLWIQSPPGLAEEHSEEMMKRLRALGYL